MNQTARMKLLLALTTAMDEALDKLIEPDWNMIHVPQELGFLMAQAALHIVDVVISTEASMETAGLLAVDENGVAI